VNRGRDVRIREIGLAELPQCLDGLVKLSVAVVAAGAELGWEDPLDPAVSRVYWESRAAMLRDDEGRLYIAEAGAIIGTVQYELGHFPTSRHRAEVAKLMVHPASRRLGIARRLMERLEHDAIASGVELFVLDTRPGEPVLYLYEALGYVRTGYVPAWLKHADGTYRDSVFCYKTAVKPLPCDECIDRDGERFVRPPQIVERQRIEGPKRVLLGKALDRLRERALRLLQTSENAIGRSESEESARDPRSGRPISSAFR
jgi:GNAT superfamily N-acetyltransferase